MFAVDSTRGGNGGIERATANLAAALAHQHSVAVVAPDSPENNAFWSGVGVDWRPTPGVPSWLLDRKRPVASALSTGRVRDALGRILGASDVIVTTHIASEIILGLGRPFPPNPRLFINHSVMFRGLSRRLLKLSLRSCRAHLAINSVTSNTLSDLGYPVFAVVPNCLPEDWPYLAGPPRRSPTPTCVTLGMIGSINQNKNQMMALQILTVLRARGIDARLRIKGLSSSTAQSHYMQELESCIGRGRLSGFVEFVSYVQDNAELYGDFDILLSLSRSESFGMAIIEAMSQGVPVISTCSGGPQELISSGVTGYVLRSEAAEEAADCIVSLCGDPAFYAQMACAASCAARVFSATQVSRHFADVLERACVL